MKRTSLCHYSVAYRGVPVDVVGAHLSISFCFYWRSTASTSVLALLFTWLVNERQVPVDENAVDAFFMAFVPEAEIVRARASCAQGRAGGAPFSPREERVSLKFKNEAKIVSRKVISFSTRVIPS